MEGSAFHALIVGGAVLVPDNLADSRPPYELQYCQPRAKALELGACHLFAIHPESLTMHKYLPGSALLALAVVASP
ncbi:MAG: hypothetical protein EOO78_27040, partial [Oxalobacteraceae bacterium]